MSNSWQYGHTERNALLVSCWGVLKALEWGCKRHRLKPAPRAAQTNQPVNPSSTLRWPQKLGHRPLPGSVCQVPYAVDTLVQWGITDQGCSKRMTCLHAIQACMPYTTGPAALPICPSADKHGTCMLICMRTGQSQAPSIAKPWLSPPIKCYINGNYCPAYVQQLCSYRLGGVRVVAQKSTPNQNRPWVQVQPVGRHAATLQKKPRPVTRQQYHTHPCCIYPESANLALMQPATPCILVAAGESEALPRQGTPRTRSHAVTTWCICSQRCNQSLPS